MGSSGNSGGAALAAHGALQDGVHGLPHRTVELEVLQTLHVALDGSSPPLQVAPNLNICARDPNTGTVATPQETLYAVSGNALLKSTSVDSSGKPIWAQVFTCTAAGYANIRQVLVLHTGEILIACAKNGTADDNDVTDILRSTDGGSTFAAVGNQPLSRGPADYYTRLLHSHSWCQCPSSDPVNPDVIFLGEYGTNGSVSHGNVRNPIGLWKSTDKGVTWTNVYEWSTVGGAASEVIRHLHSVQCDPYVAGRIWVCIGDNGSEPRIGYSDNGGTSWTYITQGATGDVTSYRRSRAVGLCFDATRVMWVSDTPDQTTATVWSYDRGSGTITRLETQGFWPNSMQGFSFSTATQDGIPVFLSCGSLEPNFAPHGGDGYIRIVGSTDGVHWSDSPWRWKTNPGSSAPGGCWQFTDPSPVDGSFWATFQNLDLDAYYNFGGIPQITMKLRPLVQKAMDKPLAPKRTRFELARQERRLSRGFEDTSGSGLTAAAAQAIPTFGYLEVPLLIAPYDMAIEEVDWMTRVAYSLTTSWYWQLVLAVWATPGSGSGASYTVGVWGGSSSTSPTVARLNPWPNVSFNGQNRIRKGHLLTAQLKATGSPNALQNLAVDLRYCAVNPTMST